MSNALQSEKVLIINVLNWMNSENQDRKRRERTADENIFKRKNKWINGLLNNKRIVDCKDRVLILLLSS